jgi:fumarate reductase flavoprotein subunit
MKVKSILLLLLVSAVVLAFAACAGTLSNTNSTASKTEESTVSPMKAGVYKQSVKGMHEGLVVEVTLSKNKIEKVEIIEHSETPGLTDAAFEKLPNRMVEGQSVAIDTVTRDSYTSNGILTAVKDAIKAAGGKI